MGVYGPYTAIAGTVQQCAVDPDAQAVYISNTTVYDLYIGMGAAKPTSVTGFGGYPWIRRIPQGDRASVQIPQDRYAGAGFPGYIWVLPLTSAVLAPTLTAAPGTISSNNAFTIEGYSNPAEIPPDIASAQFQNLASQPRIINIPVVPAFDDTFALGIHPVVGPGAIGNILNIPGTGWPASQVTLYLYHIEFMVTQVRWAMIQILGVGVNGGGATVTSAVICQLMAVCGIPTSYTPFGPLAALLTVNASVAAVQLQMQWIEGFPNLAAAGFMSAGGQAALDADIHGQSPPPAIGNGAATPPGAIY